MTKRYVLDTNVYLTNYQSIYSYEDGDIIIPLKVLEEIDKHKKRQDSVGYNARQTIRALDELRELGNLCEGVTLPDSTGRIIARSFDAQDIPSELDSTDADNQIISTALTCVRESEAPLIVVTRDINMRVKCDALGLKTEDYEPDKVIDSSEDLYKGILDVKLSDEDIDNFYFGNNVYLEQDNLLPNQYLMLTSKDDEKKTALARFSKAGLPLKKIFDAKYNKSIDVIRTESNDNRSYHINSDKIKNELGFIPSHSISDAINSLFDAFDKKLVPNSFEDDIYFNVKRMQNLNVK